MLSSGVVFLRALRLGHFDRQLLIACGAGAGLASVYQVPFASTCLFDIRVTWKPKNIVIILVTTYVSAYCARPIVGKEGQCIKSVKLARITLV
ncbi:MAG: chloride channel protein [Streptococcus sp.]